jgi:hypothetical protein
VKPIVRGKSWYKYFKDEDEIFIDENEINTTCEFHYQNCEKSPMELESEGLLNTSNTFV